MLCEGTIKFRKTNKKKNSKTSTQELKPMILLMAEIVNI